MGEYTANSKFYKPALGETGAANKTKFDEALDAVDVDIKDLEDHAAATEAHDATGAVVGTTNTQTLTNKTLTTPTIASFANANHDHSNSAGGGTTAHSSATAAHGATGAVVGTTNTQTLSSKTLTTPTIASFVNATHDHASAAGGGYLNMAASNPTNLLVNGNFELWNAGATSAPNGWILNDGAVAREATIIRFGTYSAKLTRSGTDCFLYIDNMHLEKGAVYWRGRQVTFSCWVYATVASRARIAIQDTGGVNYSSYHTGDSSWQLLSVTVTVNASTTFLRARLAVDTGDTSAYFDGATVVEGNVPFAFSPKPISGIYAGSYEHNVATTGDFTLVSSLPFRPRKLTIMASIVNGIQMSTGFSCGKTGGEFCLAGLGGAFTRITAYSIYLYESSGVVSFGSASFGADSITITWEKQNSPTGTASIIYMVEG